MKKIIEKYREIIVYVIFGVLTTAVNFVSYYLFSLLLSEKFYLVTNFIAWIIAVIFAYITNKIFVFESKSLKAGVVAKEVIEFFLARAFSFLIEEAGLYIFVSLLGFGKISFTLLSLEITGQLIAKVILAVIVIILNYFFSKFVIFKKEK